MPESDTGRYQDSRKSGDNHPELVSPPWHVQAKLIGYGHYSLVFRPPALVPNHKLCGRSENTVTSAPDRFVGLITTERRYQAEIKPSTDLLKQLLDKKPSLAGFVVLPCALSGRQDHLGLEAKQVEDLMARHHAVKKRVEYQKTWHDERLVQVIYPYAGEPLERAYKIPESAPTWKDFFQGMTGLTNFIQSLHHEDYVHGDLSPNNVLYDEPDGKPARFTLVDWNMLSKAEKFLGHAKGDKRVGCWSPEHFSLTTIRRQQQDRTLHWKIYGKEMMSYQERMLGFARAAEPASIGEVLTKQFESTTGEDQRSKYRDMFEELERVGQDSPASIGKYHDLRYLMDTIAKSVAHIFPEPREGQRQAYYSFLALVLTQNLPGRSAYLETPERLGHRLAGVLQLCAGGQKNVSLPNDCPPPLEVETAILNSLNGSS